MSLSATGFEFVAKRTCKREFLDGMNLVALYSERMSLIALHPPTGKTGRPAAVCDIGDAARSPSAAVLLPLRPGNERGLARHSPVP